jgi:hypothetical protein
MTHIVFNISKVQIGYIKEENRKKFFNNTRDIEGLVCDDKVVVNIAKIYHTGIKVGLH